MSSSSRRTYDTDTITLRTVFAKNPGNSNVPALRVLTADGTGGTYWAIPSSLGLNPSFNEIITSAATYTADLSYNKFRLLAGENIGMVNGSPGSNQTTLFAKAFSQFDLSGGNTIKAFTGNQLDSSVLLAGENGIVLRADPGTNTLFISASDANNISVSTGIYGFNQVKVTAAASTITSSLTTWGGDYLTATSPSSLLRFVGYNDIQLSTNVTTNSVFFTISTFTSQGYLNISNAALSAGPSTLSTVSSLYVQTPVFNSTVAYLSSVSGVDYSTIQSSIKGLSISTGLEILTLQGLVNARATIVQLNSQIATVNLNLLSTVGGLGTAGYISTGAPGTGDVTTAQLKSSITGLGTIGYTSTPGGGFITDSNIASTLQYSGYFSSIKFGYNAGYTTQALNAIAIGNQAGSNTQGSYTVGIGYQAGYSNQGNYSIAIGSQSGYSNQAPSSIVISALASTLNATTQGLFIAPIRDINGSQTHTLGYNSNNAEIGLITGGGGITTANLTSTTTGLGTLGYLSSKAVNVVVSSLGNTDSQLSVNDIGKYFLFTQIYSGKSILMPSLQNGWNVTIKNMPASTSSFTVNAAVIAPGVATTVVCDGTTFYSI